MNERMGADAPAKIRGELTRQSDDERARLDRLREIEMQVLPHLGPQWNIHQAVFLRRQSLTRLAYYYELYRKILDVPGVICEFGVQWGTGLATLIGLRGMFEPYDHSRVIYGFDTFEGFAHVSDKDGEFGSKGDYATLKDYHGLLQEIIQLQESFSPLPHIRKFELVKGDVSETVSPWLARNPHAIIALAIFDMDLYQPTKDVLTAILPRLTKGSVLAFDELNCDYFPGETTAVAEVMGLNRLRLRHFPHMPCGSWAVFGE